MADGLYLWLNRVRRLDFEVPSDAELVAMQERGELPSDEELAREILQANTVIQKYFLIDGDGFAITRTKDELWKDGIDVSRLPTPRFAIIDTGEFLPIRDLANCAVFAKEADLKKHIPVWSKD